MQSDYDAAILGAGPAGCAAAISCAEAGLRAVIIERADFPRYRPGETLHPGAGVILDQLGVLEEIETGNFERHLGQRIMWTTAEESEFTEEEFGADDDGSWRGFQIPGEKLDAILLARALALGIDILQPCEFAAPIVEKGTVCGVTHSGGNLHASFTIDASGRNQRLAKSLGIEIEKHSPPLAARFGYVTGVLGAEFDTPQIARQTDGWTWIAKIGEDTYHWTRLAKTENCPDPSWVPPELSALTPGSPISRGADMTWRIAEKVCGQGFILIGDAGAVLDPASSHGVLRALMSGIMASFVVRKNLLENADAEVCLAHYGDWFRDWFEADKLHLEEFYAQPGGSNILDR